MTGRSMDPKRASAQAQAIAEALGRLGEPITEARAREIAVGQQCDCQEGADATRPPRQGRFDSRGRRNRDAAAYEFGQGTARRGRISSAGRLDEGAGPLDGRRRRLWLPLAVRDRCALGKPDPYRLFHAPAGELRHHHAIRPALRTASRRHPEYRSFQTPPRYPRHGRPADQVSLADLKRFPTVSRTYFLECSGTTGSEIMKAREPTVQRTHGLVSTSE